MDLTFHVPARYLSRRARLIITPQLVQHDTVRDEYMPLVVDASIFTKKTRRKEVLEDYQDPYKDSRVALSSNRDSLTLAYTQSVTVPQGIDAARIRAVVSEDGCGECSGIDTIDMASVSTPVTLMEEVKESFNLAWIEPKFVIRPKIRQGSGVAHLQFIIEPITWADLESAGLTWEQLEEQFDSWLELESSFFCHLEGEAGT